MSTDRKREIPVKSFDMIIERSFDKKRRSVLGFLLIMTLLGITVINAPLSVNANENETNKMIYNFWDYWDTDRSWEMDLWVVYDLLVNESRIPINKTYLEIPELNYSISYKEPKNKSDMMSTWLTFILSNVTYHSSILGVNSPYYYSSVIDLDYLYSPVKKKLDAWVKGTMDPFKIKEYVNSNFYQFLSLFSSDNNEVNEDVSYKDILTI